MIGGYEQLDSNLELPLLNVLFFYIGNSTTLEQLLSVESTFYDTLQLYWREHNYLTAGWWLLVVLSILSPITWWKLVDKKRITEITAFGLFYGMSAIILDSIGSNALAWTYPVRLSPYLYPQLYPYDVGIVIVPFMLVYQRWGNNTKRYLLFTVILSAFLAFVAEPLMEYINVYQEITWKNIYSFPIYWILGITCWLIINYFKKVEQR